MAGEKNTGKKGFSGLSDLVSEVSLDDEPQKQARKTEASPPPAQVTQPQQKEVTPKPQGHSTGLTHPAESAPSGKRGSSSPGKWVLIGLAIIFVIWLANSGGQNNRAYSPPPSPAPQSRSAPAATPTALRVPPNTSPNVAQSTGLQYTTPSVGTNNLLSVPEIQWCIRNDIRIETMRDLIDTNAGIDEFNRIVNDHNSRCGNYRYRQGTLVQAERSVESYRSQIVAEAIREAKQLGRPQQPSYPSTSRSSSASSAPEQPTTNSASEKPNAQYTREAQQLLTDLGYDPGPVDGDYGRRTAEAVRAFQHKAGVTQDGRIDEGLLNMLRLAKTEYKPPVVSQPKPQAQASLQPRSNTPAAVITAKPGNLSLEEQSKYNTAQRLARLGYDVDWQTSSLTNMLDAESRINTANRLARLGYKVDWRNYSLADMLDAESKIGTAARLARLGYNVDWRTTSLTDMLDAEARIGAANRLIRKGISVDWRNYSLTQLLNMEYRR